MSIITHRIKMRRGRLEIRAFTLLESLLVLSLTSFLMLLFSMNLTKTVHVVKGELFVLQFENLYKEVQGDAILLEQNKALTVKNGQLLYENQVITVPIEVEMNDFTFTFDKKGGNSSLQKFQIFMPYEKKTISYQLEIGSGKFKKKIS